MADIKGDAGMENNDTVTNLINEPVWVVAQVISGKEEEVRKNCADMLKGGVLEDVFVPRQVRLKKYKDGWRRERRPLYPGYVFMVTSDPQSLEKTLIKVPGRHRLLKADDIILTVSEEEKEFLQRLAGPGNIVDISTGYKEGDAIKILSGPMVGLEGHIVHVDRHKRLVTINVSLFGRTVKTTLGLELTYKQP